MAFGDYLQLQRENHGFAVDIDIAAAAVATTAAKTVRSANHQIFVQRIVLSITTHVAAKVFSVQSSNGTPVVIASRTDLAAAAGVPDVIVWDFGPIGTPVALGESLHYLSNTGGSGFVGRVHIEGYQKLAATINKDVTLNTAN